MNDGTDAKYEMETFEARLRSELDTNRTDITFLIWTCSSLG